MTGGGSQCPAKDGHLPGEKKTCKPSEPDPQGFLKTLGIHCKPAKIHWGLLGLQGNCVSN